MIDKREVLLALRFLMLRDWNLLLAQDLDWLLLGLPLAGAHDVGLFDFGYCNGLFCLFVAVWVVNLAFGLGFALLWPWWLSLLCVDGSTSTIVCFWYLQNWFRTIKRALSLYISLLVVLSQIFRPIHKLLAMWILQIRPLQSRIPRLHPLLLVDRILAGSHGILNHKLWLTFGTIVDCGLIHVVVVYGVEVLLVPLILAVGVSIAAAELLLQEEDLVGLAVVNEWCGMLVLAQVSLVLRLSVWIWHILHHLLHCCLV